MGLDNVIVFDGSCGLCSKSVRFLARADKRGLFRFAAVESKAGAELLERFGLGAEASRTLVLVQRDKAYLRSDAALRIARGIGGFWRLAGILVLVPKPIRDWLYDVLARNRYRWFGKRESCAPPPADVAARFLE